MSKDIEEMLKEAPELTLSPLGAGGMEETQLVQTESVLKMVEEAPVSELTPEEERQVADFAEKIDLRDSNLILQYGAGAQKKIADFSEAALDNVKSKDLGEVGQILSEVVVELKSIEVEEEEKGLFGLFKKSVNRVEGIKAKYAKAETNVNQICKALQNHQIQLLKDIALLDKMYDLNTTYFKELTMYIMAGKRKLARVQQEELPVLLDKAAKSGLPEDAQAANDLSSMLNRFEKKLHDLELTRMISIQMAPQIRLVQNNDTLMTEKIQSTLVNTIPLWKSQMVLAIGISHSEQAAKAQREVTDMTNDLLKKNAEVLKTATIQTAKESERGIVDMETLKKTNESLITTLDEVVRIQADGRTKRREAEVELSRMEGELKSKLLQLSK
ncbi:toxic anion resistance protein [Lacrimispora celerecrescens]|uniref:Tellurium resistance protein n=1 Tax=Lacrimispora celerecrescens TaxID=29354 RepID=A0A084JRE7_9FIRM|nr:toxic anion resistance protein [Lacrimispora celerecrescens]KEZ91531.1 tellurium resistance protein [Lacrimispora celerecrescens]